MTLSHAYIISYKANLEAFTFAADTSVSVIDAEVGLLPP